MNKEKIIKIIISSIFGLIINQSFSITEIIRKILEPLMMNPFLSPIKSFVILCFFIAEIAGTYEILEKLNLFDKLGLD